MYSGLRWAAGRSSTPLLYQFAKEINVQPSTMQTKIRAMIRYGFLRATDTCPLAWTRLGELWNELHTVGNERVAREVYRITLAHALALFAFDEKGFTTELDGAMFPLQQLLRTAQGGGISVKKFQKLVDGKTNRKGANDAYWRADLTNSGLFTFADDRLVVSKQFRGLAEAIRDFSPAQLDTDANWRESRANQLWQSAPFRVALRELLFNISRDADNDSLLLPLETAFVETLEDTIAARDYNLKSNSKTTTFTTLQRSIAWGRFVKDRYGSSCAMPKCDVTGPPFIEAAHIKPHAAKESKTPHRAHVLNGMCLCKHCHSAFDKGLFSLNDKRRVIVSGRLAELKAQHPKTVVESSAGFPMRPPVDGPEPLSCFIKHHRANVFRAC